MILFELLTGERPFRGSLAMLLRQHVEDDAPSPRRLVAGIPRDLETICLKCLEKEPRLRYPPGRPYQVGGNAVARTGVHHWLAGSPTGLAESGSSSYGLVVRLRLLPTPPYGDAVTFSYRFVTYTSWGLAPHRSNVFKDALAVGFSPRVGSRDIAPVA